VLGNGKKFDVAFVSSILQCSLICFLFALLFLFVSLKFSAYDSNIVDLHNSATGAWSTAHLSVSRVDCAATTVGHFALFAGGGNYPDVIDLYNGVSGKWSTDKLSVGRSQLQATSVGSFAMFAGGQTPNKGEFLCLIVCVINITSLFALRAPILIAS